MAEGIVATWLTQTSFEIRDGKNWTGFGKGAELLIKLVLQKLGQRVH